MFDESALFDIDGNPFCASQRAELAQTGFDEG